MPAAADCVYWRCLNTMQVPPLPKKGGLKCEQLQTRRVDMKRHEEEDLGSVQIPWLAVVSLHAKQWHLKDQKKIAWACKVFFCSRQKHASTTSKWRLSSAFLRAARACRMHKVHQRESETCNKAAGGRRFLTRLLRPASSFHHSCGG